MSPCNLMRINKQLKKISHNRGDNMSGAGRMRAILEARRKEELRKERVREECAALLAAIQNKINNMSTAEVQGVSGELSSLMQRRERTSGNIQSSPDESLVVIKEMVTQLSELSIKGERDAEAWDDKKRAWMIQMEETELHIESLGNLRFKRAQKAHKELKRKIQKMKTVGYSEGPALEMITQEVDNVKMEIQEEEIRREIIVGLIKTLKQIGMSASKPKKGEENWVVLTGTLPNGKQARFQIAQDGTTEFSFHGYKGVSCKDQLDNIKDQLLASYNIDSSIEQFNWYEDPELIEKGAKDFTDEDDTPVSYMTR